MVFISIICCCQLNSCVVFTAEKHTLGQMGSVSPQIIHSFTFGMKQQQKVGDLVRYGLFRGCDVATEEEDKDTLSPRSITVPLSCSIKKNSPT